MSHSCRNCGCPNESILHNHEMRIFEIEEKFKHPIKDSNEGRAPTIESLQEMVRKRDVTIEDNQKIIRDLDTRIGDPVTTHANLRAIIVDHNKRFEEIIGIVGVKL